MSSTAFPGNFGRDSAHANAIATGNENSTARPATPISDLYQSPEKFVGQTVRLDGVVTAVCESMGCWMALADAADAEKVVRLKVDHGAGVVFPIAAKGKTATAEGVFERIADAEGREAAGEHAAHGAAADFGKTFHIKATGAVIR